MGDGGWGGTSGAQTKADKSSLDKKKKEKGNEKGVHLGGGEAGHLLNNEVR